MKLFNSIQLRKPKLNKFDLSAEKKLTLRMGNLVPILLNEILPGDRFKVNTEVIVRLLPLLAPIYGRLRIQVDYFFVPNRLLWSDWEKFITGGETGNDNPPFPHVVLGESNRALFGKGTLADYMGIPTPGPGPIASPINASALPFRAYAFIFNEYYRDQNLQTKIPFNIANGGDTTAEFIDTGLLRNRAWERDYFTSGLPTPQKGGDVLIPIDPVVTYKPTSDYIRTDGTTPAPGTSDELLGNSTNQLGFNNPTEPAAGLGRIENIEGISNATTSIEDLRRAARLQEWLERNMRAGSRYVESLLAHFGVHNEDLRMMRPQYLGGWQNPIVVSEVLSNFQFSGDPDGLPQGNMAGHGIGVGNGSGFTGKFKEHGYVMGLMSILPRTSYQQGVERHWQKQDRFDFAWPSFAQLGEQAIWESEIFKDWHSTTNGFNPFAYQSRFCEYKTGVSTVHGDFRDTLQFWHPGRIFTAPPQLNSDFITSDPTDRIYAVQTPETMHCLVNLYNRIDALRELPYFNTPTL